MRLEYDPAVLESPGAHRGPLLHDTHVVEAHSPKAGELNVVVDAPSGPAAFKAATGTVFYLTLRVKSTASPGTVTPITFSSDIAGSPGLPASSLSDTVGNSISHSRSGGSVTVTQPTPTPTETPVATATPTPSAPPEPIQDLITSFYELILGRDPEPGAVDAWQTGYFEYAVGFNIDVRFVPREMARLFFLSVEYENRSRTDGEFITDCYRVFLDRNPNEWELSEWLSGIWNRSEVMTIFSESEEFANRIQTMFPGLEGNPTRNFVTVMYIGLLDRLVDSAGLDYATSAFDAATDKRALAKQMARDILVSPEFTAKNPSTAVIVERLYRAFLGRFPNATETAYWVGQLDVQGLTTDQVIEFFADSAEYTTTLTSYFGALPTPTPTPGNRAEVTVNLPGSVPLVLVRIPAGSFLMGRYPGEQDSRSDEAPQHTVTIAYDFHMGKYEVTKAQWQAVMGTTPWYDSLNDPASPAENVSWNDIVGSGGFIERLNQHITSTGQGPATCRLPSEAEWEYSCRAGTTTRFYWGDDPSYTQIGDYTWYRGNAYDVGEFYAHVVGLKLPNAWGLFDMSGNVDEWCQDWYHDSYSGAPTDGSAWTVPPGLHPVIRGGNYILRAPDCRLAIRGFSSLEYPDTRINGLGFRFLRTQN